MLHTSQIELSKSNLETNIRFMKGLIGPETRYSMVIKGNAYGHGIEDFIPIVEDCGVDHFSVFSVAEAMRAQKVKKAPSEIMIMGFVGDGYHEWVIDQEISFFVFTFERLHAALQAAKTTSRKARIHIELETGMHRTGFREEDLEKVAQTIQESPDALELEGFCTHFAGAEHMSNYDRVQDQIKNFDAYCDWFESKGLYPKSKHVACSAGVFNFPDQTRDLVRIGIAGYGFWPSNETKLRYLVKEGLEEDPLKRVLSWKSNILSINPVDEGLWISYGKSYMTNRPSKIATVPVGYGYGFNRDLSNKGHVLVCGKRVPVVGAVNMNMMVIDVTDVPDVKTGAEVVLIGKQKDLTITVSSFGEMNNSMNYELLARLPHHIPRRPVGSEQ